MRWICQGRPEGLTEDLCRIMGESGCALLALGRRELHPELRRSMAKVIPWRRLAKESWPPDGPVLLTTNLHDPGPSLAPYYIQEEVDFLI